LIEEGRAGEVLPDDGTGLRVSLDEVTMAGAAAQRFNAEGAGTAVKVENVFHVRAVSGDKVEDYAADEVGCGPHARSRWAFEIATAGGAAFDSHR
jgi:hypothetical protein